MRIKEKPKITRKQKSYLKWMGLTPPKRIARLPQLNKFHRKRKRPTEFVLMAQSIEAEPQETIFHEPNS